MPGAHLKKVSRDCAAEREECAWPRKEGGGHEVELAHRSHSEQVLSGRGGGSWSSPGASPQGVPYETRERRVQLHSEQANGRDSRLGLGEERLARVHQESMCFLRRVWHHGPPQEQGIHPIPPNPKLGR